MRTLKAIASFIAMLWDEFASSRLFIFVMPVIVGLMVAVFVHIGEQRWDMSINNPANAEHVVEVAFDLGIPVDSVTQKQFNNRYGQ